MGEYASKYTFEEHRDGFTIKAPDRVTTTVTLLPTHFDVQGLDKYGLFEYYKLSRAIAQHLMLQWTPPEREGRKTWYGVQDWAVTQTAGAIGKRVHAQWRRLLRQADPVILDVQRAVFAATLGACDLLLDEELYRREYVARDIVRYRAAAIAATHARALARAQIQEGFKNTPLALKFNTMRTELAAAAHRAGLELCGADWWISLKEELSPVEAMENWRALFSVTGETYHALNVTLDNLPGGLPHKAVCALRAVRLTHPILERLELLTLLSYLKHRRPHDANRHLFQYAKTPEIKRAMERIAAHLGAPLNPRRAKDVQRAVMFMADYPERHNGTIAGLARRAIAWHVHEQERELQKQIDALGADTETAIPPIPLPTDPRVTFLPTVLDVCEEGAHMGHCVATYALDAVRGLCYLFHVEHNGERATVEVSWQGTVNQVQGPGNQSNTAVRWAKRALSRWGAEFPEELEPPRPELMADGLPPGFVDEAEIPF